MEDHEYAASPVDLAKDPVHKRVPVTRSASYSAVEFKLSTTRHKDERFCDLVPAPLFFSCTRENEEDLFY